MLSIEEQINKLELKGIKFDIITKDKSYDILSKSNYYFKLKSYKDNYDKHILGISEGKYINLDFFHLYELSVLDYNLRKYIYNSCLDIEHLFKLRLLEKILINNDNEYDLVKKFSDKLEHTELIVLKSEIERAKKSEYTRDLLIKYKNNMPLTVLFEIIPFGRFISFYKFYSEYKNDKTLKEEFYILNICKQIRNASAHNNCILNNLKNKSSYGIPNKINEKLKRIKNISKNVRRKKMLIERIKQIVTILYINSEYIKSDKLKEKNTEELKKLKNRFMKNINYFKNNDIIYSTFIFLGKVIDNWYEI